MFNEVRALDRDISISPLSGILQSLKTLDPHRITCTCISSLLNSLFFLKIFFLFWFKSLKKSRFNYDKVRQAKIIVNFIYTSQSRNWTTLYIRKLSWILVVDRTSYGVMHNGRKFWSPYFCGSYAPWNFTRIFVNQLTI